jgi:hypothetical protein
VSVEEVMMAGLQKRLAIFIHCLLEATLLNVILVYLLIKKDYLMPLIRPSADYSGRAV